MSNPDETAAKLDNVVRSANGLIDFTWRSVLPLWLAHVETTAPDLHGINKRGIG